MSRGATPTPRPFWSLQQWMLGAFFLASGVIAWWQLQPNESPAPDPGRARLPDYIVTGFNALETDEAGRPSRRLSADELRQFVEEDLSELDQPRMTLYTGDGEPWRARADRGLALAGGEELQLLGGVEIERAASATMRPAHLETELLRIWHERAFAETDRPVLLTSERDRLTATGMRLWYDPPVRAEFDGRARIRIVPESVEEP
jgi:lipopolysaccharide export system protein LptC